MSCTRVGLQAVSFAPLLVSFLFSIMQSAANSPPVAANDSYTRHGSGVIGSVLANDFDPDGDPMSPVVVTFPAHGQLFGLTSGSWLYSLKDLSFTGTDTFTYQACDIQQSCSNVATVTITVVNEPPLANNDTYTINGITNIGPMLANDFDPDGDQLMFTLLTLPGHGTLFGLAQPDRKSYRPNAGYVGTDSFTYKACDDFNLCSGPATVTLNVGNSVPVAGDDVYAVPSNGGVIGPLLINDFDPDGNQIEPAPDIITFPLHGRLFGLVEPDKKLYVPNPGFAGTDNFTYQIRDELSGISAPATVTLYVLGDGVNDGICDCKGVVGAPINVSNGNMYLQQNDYELVTAGFGISLTRTYNSNSLRVGLFGRGWSTIYDESVEVLDSSLVRLNQPDGRAIYFGRPLGSLTDFKPVYGDFHATLTQRVDGFTLLLKGGSVQQFNSAGKLVSLIDRNGNLISLTYANNGVLSSISDQFGRTLTITTDINGLVGTITDVMGIVATYTYGAGRELVSIRYPDNSGFNFSYDTNQRLTSVTDALGNVLEAHTYDAQGRAVASEKQNGVEQYSLSFINTGETDVIDALGRRTRYTFDISKGRNVITRVEGMCSCGGSQVQTWTYDSQLNITSKTDALGHVVSYTYDGDGNRLSGTDPTGTVSYTFNAFGEILTRTDQLNNMTTNSYDARGNLLISSDALDNHTTRTYNSRGQVLTRTDARGSTTTFTYGAAGNVSRRTDANGVTTFFFYDARGRLTKLRDALSRSTIFSYDAFGRIIKLRYPDNSSIRFTYDLAGRRTAVTDERGNPTNYAYDGAYRLTSVTDAASHTTRYGYDSMSKVTSVTDSLGRTANYDYDDFNQLVKITYPGASRGAVRLFEMIAYDQSGNIISRTDTAGRVTNYAYDSANRLTGITDAASKLTSFQYDALSRVTALTDAINQQYQFVYDALGREVQVTRAGVSMNFLYDAVGNRIQRTDYNGVTTNYSYDNLNRLTTIAYPTHTSTYSYDPLNNLTRAANENGTVDITYDSRYRVTSFSDPFSYGVSYNYDEAGNRTKLSVNGAAYATYAYDSVNRLTRLKDGGNQSFNFTYDAVNRLISRTAPNGVISRFAYDDLDRLSSLTHTTGMATLSANLYSYNDANNLSVWTTPTARRGYAYDALDRLTGVTNFEIPAESYSYDAVDNRTASHLSAGYTYQPFNRLVQSGDAGYVHDNNGNLVSKTDGFGTRKFTYDEDNRLIQVTLGSGLTIKYKYDALGRRIQRMTSAGANERYVYDGQDVLVDLSADWTVAATYLNDLRVDNHLRQTSATTGVSYFVTDHLGSTAALTNAAANVVEQNGYDSFGRSSGYQRTRYGYTGRERDPDTGLLYYRARFYDPEVGRFISEDPVGLGGGTNAFIYVGNNPENALDPFGLYEIDVHYYLTYYLAKQTGCFSSAEAQQIANADQYVDENPETMPGFGGNTPISDPRPNYQQQQANIDYHALHAGSHQPYLNMHWRRATGAGANLGELGVYLHYLQDTFSHRGFVDPLYGHSPLHGGSHADDKTDENFDQAIDMAMATFAALTTFVRETGRRCKCSSGPDWLIVRRFAAAPGGNAITRRAYDIEHVNPWYLKNKVRILGVPWR